MKSGRWNSESEIVRYGIELVRREVQGRNFPNTPKVLWWRLIADFPKRTFSKMSDWAEPRRFRRRESWGEAMGYMAVRP